MWQHAKVYDAIITRQLHRLDMPRAELSWHIIWLWHDGYIGLDRHGEPRPLREIGVYGRRAA